MTCVRCATSSTTGLCFDIPQYTYVGVAIGVSMALMLSGREELE